MKQKVEYQNKNRSEHHCQTMVVHCIDWRFQDYISDLLDQLFADDRGVNTFDRLAVGGASKAIIDKENWPTVMGAIDIATKKHQIKKIIIIDHIDCGVYMGSAQHQNPEAEEKFHHEKLLEAKKILVGKYPNLEIILLYQDFYSLKFCL